MGNQFTAYEANGGAKVSLQLFFFFPATQGDRPCVFTMALRFYAKCNGLLGGIYQAVYIWFSEKNKERELCLDSHEQREKSYGSCCRCNKTLDLNASRL